MVPAADPTGDRRRLERVSQLEHVARVLLPQRHYQHVEQSPYEKARLAGQHATESAADSRERQPELPEGIPRKARNADRGVRPRNQIAAARADRVGHQHREAHHAVQARFFFATGRAGQILARKAARLHFLSGKLPQAGKQEDSDSGADRRVREPDEELFLRRQQADRRDHDPRGRRTASDQDVRRLSAQPHVQ